jgi:hypothetical protein
VLKLILPLLLMVLADGQVAAPAAPAPPPPVLAPAPAPSSGGGLFKSGPPSEARRRALEGSGERRAPRNPSAPRSAALDRELPPELGREGGRDGGREYGREYGRSDMSERREPSSSGRRIGASNERSVADNERVVTPSAGLSANAMHDELGQHASNQKAASERERLEALSSDLARARTALREETARLEGMMDKAKQAGVFKPGAPGAAAMPAGEGGGPATMPIGDPMAPTAYFRPQPPPPSFAAQVDVVSKAIKSMKPEQAAGLIGHLERGLAAEVLQRMRAADAGAILGFLKPEVGAALAAEIVSRPPVGSKSRDSDKEKP